MRRTGGGEVLVEHYTMLQVLLRNSVQMGNMNG